MTQPQTPAGTILAQFNRQFTEVPQEDRGPNVCKTIAFKRSDGWPLAVLIPLSDRVSYKKLKAYAGVDVAPMSPDELAALGFKPHECAPMLMPCELLVDPQCLVHDPIQTGSGTVGWGIQWHLSDLAPMKAYQVVDVREDPKRT